MKELVIKIPEKLLRAIKVGTVGCEYNVYDLAIYISNGISLEEYCNICESGNPCLYCKHKFEEVEESEET